MGLHPGQELFTALSARGRDIIWEFKPHQLDNVLWAIAELGEAQERNLWAALAFKVSRAQDMQQVPGGGTSQPDFGFGNV
jgi:hypothetical protein